MIVYSSHSIFLSGCCAGQPLAAKPPSPPTSHAAPRLVEPMKDREVREGEPVQFQCRISAVPDPVVQWFYNNQVATSSSSSYLFLQMQQQIGKTNGCRLPEKPPGSFNRLPLV